MTATLRPDEYPLGRRTAPHAEALCGSTSVSWRLHEQGGVVMAMAKARAALLQIAHPAIAAGLRDHSTFEADPFRRIRTTGQTMSAILFGSPAERAEALRLLGAVHAGVRGTLADGTAYRATDPAAQWFVLATLADSDLLVEARYLRLLVERDRDGYYEESLRLAEAFRIPAALVAPNRRALAEYVESAYPALEIDDDARRLGTAVLDPTYLRAPSVFRRGYRTLMVDLLPRRLRVAFGAAEEPTRAARAVVKTAELALPRIPGPARRATRALAFRS